MRTTVVRGLGMLVYFRKWLLLGDLQDTEDK